MFLFTICFVYFSFPQNTQVLARVLRKGEASLPYRMYGRFFLDLRATGAMRHVSWKLAATALLLAATHGQRYGQMSFFFFSRSPFPLSLKS